MRRHILTEGYTPNEILAFPATQIEELIVTGEPLTLQIGSAQILAEFRRDENCLRVELAHIDGGGEGALPTLWLLVERYARQNGLDAIEWIVYATNCANPNPKLRPLLERRGFEVRDVAGIGAAYYLKRELD